LLDGSERAQVETGLGMTHQGGERPAETRQPLWERFLQARRHNGPVGEKEKKHSAERKFNIGTRKKKTEKNVAT